MMKYRIVSLAIIALSLGQPLFCQTGLDLERCIQLAYQNYPQIKEYDLIEASKKYDIKNAALAWAPQLSVSGKASWQSVVVEMPWDIPGMELDIPHTQYGVTADLSQQIWDGGASAIKKKLVNAEADVNNKQLEVNLYSIRNRVQNIFLGIKLIEKQIELNGLLMESLERTRGEIESMVENGVAYGTDLDQIKVNLLSCEQQKEGLETDRMAYVKMLGILTGQDLGKESFQEPEIGLVSEGALDITRPELELYDAQAKQIELRQKQLNVNIAPKLNLNIQAGYARPGLNMLSGKFDPYVMAGLKLQWNFGGLYTLKNDRRKNDLEASRLELLRKSFMMNTSIEAMEKESEMRKAGDIMAKDDEIISLRHRIRESAEAQYKEGIIKMNDYLSLLDDEFKARLDSSIHYIQYVMAVYDLRNTLGIENK